MLSLFGVPGTSQGDFPASRMINSVPGVDEARKQRLIKVLDIDPEWRMHQVSDGQRRRVQICVGLLRPFKVRWAPQQMRLVFLRFPGNVACFG